MTALDRLTQFDRFRHIVFCNILCRHDDDDAKEQARRLFRAAMLAVAS